MQFYILQNSINETARFSTRSIDNCFTCIPSHYQFFSSHYFAWER